ncbi:MAG: MFS transporter [Chloroflexi bacterium]|nr:MFS transporter [Chloroflexota bacterium]
MNTIRQSWLNVPSVVRRNLTFDFASAVFYGVYLSAINTFVPVIARRLGASAFLLALITAAPAVGNIIAVFASHYLQRRRKLPFMVAAWTIGRGLFILTPLVVTPVPFVLIVVVHWLIVSLSITGYVEIVRAIYPAAIRGRAMAYVRVGFTATATIITPIIGQLLDVWSYQVLFPIAAICGVLSGWAFGQVTCEESVADKQSDLLEPLRVFWRDVRFRDYSIAFMLCGFGNLLVVPLIPILLVDELQLNYGQVGLLGMINSIFWMVFYVVWGRSVDRRGGLWTVKVNLFLTTFMSLAFCLAYDMWLAGVAYIIIGITVAGSDLGWMNAIMQFARPEEISHYTALHAFLVGVRGIVAPLLGTVLMTIPLIGLRGVFLISASMIFLGWFLMRRIEAPPKVEV